MQFSRVQFAEQDRNGNTSSRIFKNQSFFRYTSLQV